MTPLDLNDAIGALPEPYKNHDTNVQFVTADVLVAANWNLPPLIYRDNKKWEELTYDDRRNYDLSRL